MNNYYKKALLISGAVLLLEMFTFPAFAAGKPLSVQITDGVGMAISQVLKKNPKATITFSLPRKREQNIPIAVKTDGNKQATLLVQIMQINGKTLQEIARSSTTVTKPSKYVRSLQPTVNPGFLKSGSNYQLQATLSAGKSKVITTQRLTINWQGAESPKNNQLPAEIAGIGNSNVSRPNNRGDVSKVNIERAFCLPVALRVIAPKVSYTLFLKKKLSGSSTETVAEGKGTAEKNSSTKVVMNVRNVSSGGIFTMGQPVQALVDKLKEGGYQLILNATDTSKSGTISQRDEVNLSASFSNASNALTCDK